MLELIILVFSSLANVLLALFVYTKNPKQPVNRTFGWLCLILATVSVINYFSLHGSDPLSAIRVEMVFVVFMALLFKWLSAWFPQVHKAMQPARWYELAVAIPLAALMVSPFTFSGVTIDTEGAIAPVFGWGIVVFAAYFVYMLGSGLAGLILRSRRANGFERSQLHYLILAIAFLAVSTLSVNLILPLVFQTTALVFLVPLILALFAGIIALAIVRQHLFDIRAAAARSVTYLLLLASLVILYATIVFSVSAVFFNEETVSTAYRLVNVAVAVFLAFTFPYLKSFFDHLTNRVFFRESYDPQEVIRTLSDTFVSQVTLEAIMQRSMKIICDNLKIAHARFIIIDKDKDDIYKTQTFGRVIGESPGVETLRKLHADLVDVDDLSDGSKKRLLAGFDVTVSVCLRTSDGITGYVLFGPKSTGSVYSAQDLKLLHIMSKELAIAVQNALYYEKIARFNIELQQKVEDATAKLRRTNSKLRELDDAKDDFVSMASHQLRTPLTSVKGYLSMVLEGDAGELKKEQRALLDESYSASQRMVYLISDFLNVSRIKTGRFMLEFADSNLASLIAEEVNQLRVTAEGHNLNFIYEQPDDFPLSRLDENKIRQVAMNMIDNAIFYTKPGGTVKVELFVQDNEIIFRVRDDGIGVPAREQKNLFEKFYRATNARKVRPDGTGLGLFMIKKVILAHGGSIIFQSKEGKGSVFGFRLPLKSS